VELGIRLSALCVKTCAGKCFHPKTFVVAVRTSTGKIDVLDEQTRRLKAIRRRLERD
jgi:hypothetical protein